jgi:hypothetical protein
MSTDDNKSLIRQYIQAIDENQSRDWSVIDEYIAEDFVAHNPPVPGVSLDREGMKEAACAGPPARDLSDPRRSPRSRGAVGARCSRLGLRQEGLG